MQGVSLDRRQCPTRCEIFVTVGTELPFDRLVGTVDEWASRTQTADVVAQIGHTDRPPRAIAWVASLEPSEFRQLWDSAAFVVAHAGMGTILTALETGKRLVVMPRRADLGEHRNDHQLATVYHLQERGLLAAVADEDELRSALDNPGRLSWPTRRSTSADMMLIDHLRRFVARSTEVTNR